MDPREQIADLTMLLRTATDRSRADTWTALPVQVHEDSDGFTCKLQPTIQGKVIDKSGKKSNVTMPTCHHAPVQFSAGGGFTITHPIKKGDEGIAIFSSRCLDEWWDQGGVQPQARERWHSLSDAMYIPGIRSKPRALGGNPDKQNGQTLEDKGTKPSTNSLQIRVDSGKYYIELTEDSVNIVCRNCTIKAEEHVEIECKTATIKASDKVTIDSPTVEITGDLKVHGEVFAKSEGKNTALSTHVHTNSGGSGNGGPPA